MKRKYNALSIPLLIVLLAFAVIPQQMLHAQSSCTEPEPPLTADFLLRAAESFWSKTDFCKSEDGVFFEIISGGVGPNGIPPIYSPIFESVESAQSWLQPQSPVVVVILNDEVRAYPLEVMTRHEIANDTVGGVPIAVTFCPLCNSAIVFDRRLDDEVLSFGVSGFLRNSDLIMWDDVTQSWWQQLTGEGIVGEYTGRKLDFITSQVTGFGTFADRFPDGQVLAGGEDLLMFQGTYGENPYVGYDSGAPWAYTGTVDSRLEAMERVLGAQISGTAVAYPFEVLSEAGAINDEIEGMQVVAFWQPGATSALDKASIDMSRDVGMAALYDRNFNGQLLTFSADDAGLLRDDQTGSVWNVFGEAVEGEFMGSRLSQFNAFPHFWFAWAAFFPETSIYGYEEGESSSPAPDSRLDLDPVLGAPDAPVTIVEYGAYACTACKAWHQAGIVADILDEFEGSVNFIFRDFPVIFPDYDHRAAQIAQCALDQSNDLFWDFHDMLYSSVTPGTSAGELVAVAGGLGLDGEALQTCYDSGVHEETVNYDLQRAQSMGLRGTPVFFINDQILFNASPEALRAAVETALDASQN